jgi:RNA polymerase sigma factor (sigma-70 family)
VNAPGDVELLRRARREPEAFCQFYERHAVRLRDWLRRQVESREVANDLTAEAFAQALVSLRRFRGENDDAAVAWLFGIARHLLFQYRRRQRVEVAARSRLAMPLRDYGQYEQLDEQLDAAALGPRLRGALAALPAAEREALALRVVHELSYEEVADRLAIAAPAARMRVSRALRALGIRLRGDSA